MAARTSEVHEPVAALLLEGSYLGKGRQASCAWGVANWPSDKNEDKFSIAPPPIEWMRPKKKLGGAEEVSAFGGFAVFDGHGGRQAAVECSLRMFDKIEWHLEDLSKLSANSPFNGSQWPEQMDEAIYRAFDDIDGEVQRKMDAGCTATIVFLLLRPDGSACLKCAWVGDSRAIAAIGGAFGPEKVTELSTDHKADLPEEMLRIEKFYENVSSHGGNANGTEGPTASPASSRSGSAQAIATAADKPVGTIDIAGDTLRLQNESWSKHNRTVTYGGPMPRRQSGVALAMADDSVKGALKTFGDRAGLKVGTGPDGLPVVETKPAARRTRAPEEQTGYGVGVIESFDMAPALLADSPRVGKSDFRDHNTQTTLPGVIPSASAEFAAGAEAPRKSDSPAARSPSQNQRSLSQAQRSPSGAFIDALRMSAKGLLKMVSEVVPQSVPRKVAPLPVPETIDRDQDKSIRARASFVGRLRDPRTGRVSKPRLFGGHGTASVGMSRSIGDRNCARACISRPDIRTVEIAAGKSARILIASDGVWDTTSNEDAVRISRPSFFDKGYTPSSAAMRVVRAAHGSRFEKGLSPDDITCFVIDIMGSEPGDPHPHEMDCGGCLSALSPRGIRAREA